MVRLLPSQKQIWQVAARRFNPTMVRLLRIRQNVTTARRWFQSHNGAIATVVVVAIKVDVFAFQSHNGAIATALKVLSDVEHSLVSIPQWCDCYLMGLSILRAPATVSIPQWCDCYHLWMVA